MPNQEYSIEGIITNAQKQPLGNLIVRATDQGLAGENLLGLGVTDEKGYYQIQFTEADLRKIGLDESKALAAIRVFDRQGRLLGRSEPVSLRGRKLKINLQLDLPDLSTARPFVVLGQVTLAGGEPARQYFVQAFDKDLRSEEPLGEAVTDRDGNYRIAYSADQFSKAEKQSADLQVRVYGQQGAVAAQSPVFFNAGRSLTVNLVLDDTGRRSELELLELAVRPLAVQVAPAELDETGDFQDITFLSGETGFRRNQIARYALACRLEAQTRLAVPFWYGLLSQGVLGLPFEEWTPGTTLADEAQRIMAGLAALSRGHARRSLHRALNGNFIPAHSPEVLEKWLDIFEKLAVSSFVKGERGSSPAFVKTVADLAGFSAKKQEQLAQLYARYGNSAASLRRALAADDQFSDEDREQYEAARQLADLTQGNFELAATLRKEEAGRRAATIRQFARWRSQDWEKIMRKAKIEPPFAIAGKPDADQRQLYAVMLRQRFAEAFPTAAFLGDLERSLSGRETAIRHARELGAFLEAHPDFDLKTTAIDAFFQDQAREDLRFLARDESFSQELKAIQRVFKLAPSFEATDTLLAAGLHSAQLIYRRGEAQFVAEFRNRPGFDLVAARHTWNRAAGVYAAALTIAADLNASEYASDIFALSGSSGRPSELFPNWQNLFGSADVCECRQCRSVYSPAAYLADLLQFLKNRPAANAADTVKDVLLRRRPDLGFIDLNCENAHTEIPYLDIVCEVLEEAVNPEPLFTLPAALEADLAAGPPANSVLDAFAAQGVDLSGSAFLSERRTVKDRSTYDCWVLHDEHRSLLIRQAGPGLQVYRLRQTHGDKDERRALPEYLNEGAYLTLSAARHPLNLPFDLFAEEVRAYLDKAKAPRWQVMDAFRGPTAPNDPGDLDLAAEYFGISRAEQTVILTPDAGNQPAYWGSEPSLADTLDALANAAVFLHRSGLDYDDLQRLLSLPFINPGNNIRIQHPQPNCIVDEKRIEGLDRWSLDRIHRFLRLWRKLGWEMWEVDLVLLHPALGGIDGEQLHADPQSTDVAFSRLILNLYPFETLRKTFSRLSVEALAALFGPMNTRSKFSRLYEAQEPSLYHNLFLNEKVLRPLDPALAVEKVDGTAPPAPIPSITDHAATVAAALGIRESELPDLLALTKNDGAPFLATSDLTLENLSFLYRTVLLAKQLRIRIADWQEIVRITGLGTAAFADPAAAQAFVRQLELMRNSGFDADELNYLLTADLNTRAAPAEGAVAAFLLTLRQELAALATIYATAAGSGSAFDQARGDAGALAALLAANLQTSGRPEAEVAEATAILANTNRAAALVNTAAWSAVTAGLAVPFQFPASITSDIEITYDGDRQAIMLTGVLTDAQRNRLLNDGNIPLPVRTQPDYQTAIQTLYDGPRQFVRDHLALFAIPWYEAPLAALPAGLNLGALLAAPLREKVAYDAEAAMLRFRGAMSAAEQSTLLGLSADADYVNAVNALATAPASAAFPPEARWLESADIDAFFNTPPVLDADAVLGNLHEAARRLTIYLQRQSAEDFLSGQFAAHLAISVAASGHLLDDFPLFGATPSTLRALLTNAGFVGSTDAIAGSNPLFDEVFQGYYWIHRCARIITEFEITFGELQWLTAFSGPCRLLYWSDLPLAATSPTVAAADLDRLLRFRRFLTWNRRYRHAGLDLPAIIRKIADGSYADHSAFAADAALLTGWPEADILLLTQTTPASTWSIPYPAGYYDIDTWEKMESALRLAGRVNASAASMLELAAPAPGAAAVFLVRRLLRSKYDYAQWIDISQGVQDRLRARKRDALAAFLLAQPDPGSPGGKWVNRNDLYSYYLIDSEMEPCMITSRIVQAHNSIQQFVQRCFLGLEPEVVASEEQVDQYGNNPWKQWQWMRKYRVWEANMKVWLYPENWLEPEFRRDKSPFFEDLENELLQNELNRDNVEDAFIHYLEKLDGVAQLEVSAFFYEENRATLHLFARTRGGDPHLYYYRQWVRNRYWTAWQPVDADIKSDYLLAAIINERLHLFWPEFREMPEPSLNRTINIPSAGDANHQLDETWKRLQIQLAVSEFRNGKWTPKRLSRDTITSSAFTGEIRNEQYRFRAVDLTDTPSGRFLIYCDGNSVAPDGKTTAYINGVFEVYGCRGVPELSSSGGTFVDVTQVLESTRFFHQQREDNGRPAGNDPLTLASTFFAIGEGLTGILDKTPGRFQAALSRQLSYFDKLFKKVGSFWVLRDRTLPQGLVTPFFFRDQYRTFFANPVFQDGEGLIYHYEDTKALFETLKRMLLAMIEGFLPALPGIDPGPRDARVLDFGEEYTPVMRDFLDTLEGADRDRVTYLLDLYYQLVYYYLAAWTIQLLAPNQRFHFHNFYHPFTCSFSKELFAGGVERLMRREVQLQVKHFRFADQYAPTERVLAEIDGRNAYPTEEVDFDAAGSYAQYNWELFFHAPLLIAGRLSTDQRFEEAREWLHYVFDPTDSSSHPAPQKFWITKPFFERQSAEYLQQRIDSILRMLAGDTTVPGASAALKQELERQVADWRGNPFDPHLIARFRSVAYQKSTVMKYIANLIAWGDHLFRQESTESVNEATQLYILAAEILGPRPQEIPPPARPRVQNFNELEPDLDALSNALTGLENLIPPTAGEEPVPFHAPPLPDLKLLYFCIPRNERLLGYWDTLADRLYKIRHCLNIDGERRQLSLFEPELDLSALLAALAGGLDLGGALSTLSTPLPHYRFAAVLQLANTVLADVKALGGALLSTLEKKDAEDLARLRQDQEQRLLEAVKEVRELQIEETRENLESLKKQKELISIRRDFYRDREFVNAGETAAMTLNSVSLGIHTAGTIMDILGGVMAIIPDFNLGASGFGGSPHATAKLGGTGISKGIELASRALYQTAVILDKSAGLVNTQASYQRRGEEWDLQLRLAEKELEQIDHQIAAAEMRLSITERELNNHELQIENSKATGQFIRNKFTNKELYEWMKGEISRVYFQSYQLAFDLAKAAERCYQYELGASNAVIQYGHWDNLHQGLLSGEKLQHDLRRLEKAYFDKNRREFELTRHYSLLQSNPMALIQLKENGFCEFAIPEELFDLDYPGHYFRRIRTVSLSLPCLAGPYTMISCTLRLQRSVVRINSNLNGGQYEHNNDNGVWEDDDRFRSNAAPVRAIATSTAQSDSGLFELSFRDERYLPFEGAGAISWWRLELPHNPGDPADHSLRQFDYNSISDVILHLRYTAREDAGLFRQAAVDHLKDVLSNAAGIDPRPLRRLFWARHEFSTAWYRFLHKDQPDDDNILLLDVGVDRLPYLARQGTTQLNGLHLVARLDNGDDYEVRLTLPTAGGPLDFDVPLTVTGAIGDAHYGVLDISGEGILLSAGDDNRWQLRLRKQGAPGFNDIATEEVEEIFLVLDYTVG